MDRFESFMSRTQPMPEQMAELDYRADYTADEFEKISKGFLPLGMEDKWFIYSDEHTLWFHRSWTGICIFKIEFERNGDVYSVRQAIVNRAPGQYTESDDGYDAKLLRFLVDNLLLDRKEPFPVPSNLPKQYPKGAYQHGIVGTGHPEKIVPDEIDWKSEE